MSMTVLIVFQSTDGHTATVAHHIAKGISDRGISVTVERADDAPPPAGFDGVVLGTRFTSDATVVSSWSTRRCTGVSLRRCRWRCSR